MQARVPEYHELKKFNELYPGSAICLSTDYGIVTGAITYENAPGAYERMEGTEERLKIQNYRKCNYWSFSDCYYGQPTPIEIIPPYPKEIIDQNEPIKNIKWITTSHIGSRTTGTRVLISCTDDEYREISKYKKGKYIEFGIFPQNVYNKDENDEIFFLHQQGRVIETQMHFTYNSCELDNETSKGYNLEKLIVYSDAVGERHHIVMMPVSFGKRIPDRPLLLADKREHSCLKNVIIAIKPIEWLFDDETKTLLSRDVLIGGINFVTHNYDWKFVYQLDDYLNNYFIKEIMQASSLPKPLLPKNSAPSINSTEVPISSDITSLENEQSQLINSKSIHELHLKELTDKRDKLIESEASSTKQKNEILSRRKKVESENSIIQDKISEIDRKIAELNSKKGDLIAGLQRNNGVLSSIDSDIEKMNASLEEVARSIQETEGELSQVTSTIDELESQIRPIASKLVRARKKVSVANDDTIK